MAMGAEDEERIGSSSDNGNNNDKVMVYHEKQRLQFCLLHCLNNLLQGKSAFTRKELDSIADNLATDEAGGRSALNPFALVLKPHRNVITGNYDANVLIAALNSRGKDIVWFDRRKGIDGFFLEVAGYGDRLLGIIANVPKPWLLGWWQGRHWVAIRKVEGTWYNLDSNKAVPVAFVDEEMDLREFFETLLANGSEIMLVSNEVAGAATQGKDSWSEYGLI